MSDLRLALIGAIQLQGLSYDGNPLPVVSVDAFFTGNDDFGSIGCNLDEHPGPQGFYSVLRTIRQRPEVQDVLVEVSQADPEDSVWPFSERIYVLTTASTDSVADWVAALQPDDVSYGWAYGRPGTAPELAPDMHVVGVWWD